MNRKATEQAVNVIKKIAPKISRLTFRSVIAAITAGIISRADEIGDAVARTLSEEAVDATDSFWAEEEGKQAAMREFREALVKLTEPDETGKPTRKLIIVVDELDRCRPDYALSLLEIIKHFFSVPGISFVLGANLHELENSVRARYGAGIDAQTYLQKFIHLTFDVTRLSKPDKIKQDEIIAYLEYASEALKISEASIKDLDSFLKLEKVRSCITFRDIHRIVSRCVLLPSDLDQKPWLLRLLILNAILLESLNRDLYREFRDRSASEEKVTSFLGIGDVLPKKPQNVPCEFKDHLAISIHCFLVEAPVKWAEEIFQKNIEYYYRGNMSPEMIQNEMQACLDLFQIPES